MSQTMEHRLDSQWQVKFMVKFRQQQSSKTSYSKGDFIESFQNVGEPTDSFEQLIRNIALIPSVNVRQRGIMSIFRKGIEPLWEDSANNRGSIIRFLMFKRQPTQQEIDEIQERKIGPVVSDQESIFMLFLTMLVQGELRCSGTANGIYFRTENNLTILEIWGSTPDFAESVSSQVRQILSHFNISTTYTRKGVQISAQLSTNMTITQIKTGTTHGRSVYSQLKNYSVIPQNPASAATQDVQRAEAAVVQDV